MKVILIEGKEDTILFEFKVEYLIILVVVCIRNKGMPQLHYGRDHMSYLIEKYRLRR